MATAVEILRELHRLRRHAKGLREEIERLPRQMRAQQTKAARAEQTLHDAQESLKKLKATIHLNEGTLKSAHAEIAKYQRQLNEAATKKEYDALQHEIAAAKATASKLEEDILNGMADAEERAAQLPETEKALQRARDEVAQFEKTSQERQARLTEELNRTLGRLKETEATLPPDERSKYERLVAARGEDGLAVVQDKSCMACYTEITAQMQNELAAGKMLLCKSCGRILYLPG